MGEPASQAQIYFTLFAFVVVVCVLSGGGCVVGAGGAGAGVGAVEASAARVATSATTRAGLSSDLAALAEANIANNGRTVIGSWNASPTYIEVAQARGASYFDIGEAWSGLSKVDRWAANTHFLDTRIAVGDTVYSTVPKTAIRPGSYLQLETQYLENNGYKWVNQWALKPSG